MLKFGIDLGGTKTEVIALNDKNETLFRFRRDTPRGDYVATLDLIKALLEQAEGYCGQRGSIGIGIPGAISTTTGKVKNANSTWLIGKSLQRDLEQVLQQSVIIANDADCFSLSEAIDGNAAGYNSAFGVILGTGVGGGIAINQKLLSGPNSITGEWGHNPLPWINEGDKPLPKCYCGKYACIESYLSGPGLVKQSGYGQELSAEQLWQRATDGKKQILDLFNTYLDRLGRALTTVINVIDPEVIIFGGGISNIPAIYQQLPAQIEKYIFSDSVETKFVPAKHGDSSGVRGAAWLGASA